MTGHLPALVGVARTFLQVHTGNGPIDVSLLPVIEGALVCPDLMTILYTFLRGVVPAVELAASAATHAATRDTARRLTLAPAGAPTTAHAQRQRWISGNREVRTAALPSAMPVISVALKPHGRISRARNSQSSEPSFCHNHKGSPPARPAARGVVGHLWTRAPSAGRSGSRY